MADDAACAADIWRNVKLKSSLPSFQASNCFSCFFLFLNSLPSFQTSDCSGLFVHLSSMLSFQASHCSSFQFIFWTHGHHFRPLIVPEFFVQAHCHDFRHLFARENEMKELNWIGTRGKASRHQSDSTHPSKSMAPSSADFTGSRCSVWLGLRSMIESDQSEC